MTFLKSSGPASSSSSSRSVSPLGASRYEQPYTPHAPQRRLPPHRGPNGPENLSASNSDSPSAHRRPSPQRTPAGSDNSAMPVQDLSTLGAWFEPKSSGLTRHRPQTSYLHSPGPKRPGIAPRTGMPLVVTNEEPDFSRPPVKMDELDSYGNHARAVTTPQRKEELVRSSVGRSVLRTGPQRTVKVVDVGIVERLLPGQTGVSGQGSGRK